MASYLHPSIPMHPPFKLPQCSNILLILLTIYLKDLF